MSFWAVETASWTRTSTNPILLNIGNIIATSVCQLDWLQTQSEILILSRQITRQRGSKYHASLLSHIYLLRAESPPYRIGGRKKWWEPTVFSNFCSILVFHIKSKILNSRWFYHYNRWYFKTNIFREASLQSNLLFVCLGSSLSSCCELRWRVKRKTRWIGMQHLPPLLSES